MRALAAALVFAVCSAGILISDIFIRGAGLDGQHGIDAHANDVAFSLFGGIALALLAIEVFRGSKNS